MKSLFVFLFVLPGKKTVTPFFGVAELTWALLSEHICHVSVGIWCEESTC